MRKWLLLLGGLLIWAAHFFLLYGFASVFPATDLARLLTVFATFVALAANGAIIYRTFAYKNADGQNELEVWVRAVAFGGALLSLIAVLWQVLPALI